MAVNYITVPLKKTSELDLIKPLKNVITANYSTTGEPENLNEALNEINKLRMNSTWRTLDKHETSLQEMFRYYDQLSSLETKCPASDVQIPFKWRAVFDKGTFFGSQPSLTLSSLAYERVCILFNIAAMETQIAASQPMDFNDDTALKTTAKYFQQASGKFQYLKNCVMSCLQQEPTADLHPDTLSALQSLMLAQAQESIFYKAAADEMKDQIIAKVASQCEELYADALKQMQKENVRILWEKDWVPTVGSKQAAFHAIAEYYQSLVCKERKDIGEELSRLQHAQELLKAAETRAGYTFGFKDYATKVNRAYEAAKKDNEFIYHARVPDAKSLPPIGKAVLARPTPMPERLSSNFQDLFGALLPVAVQQAVHVFDTRKTDIVNGEITKLRDASQMMNGMLASLNLPAALEDTTGSSLPQSLQDKATAVQSRGGIDALQQLIEELPQLLQRNNEILDEADRMLRDEEQSDNQLRNQFKERWTRTSSVQLNSAMKVTAQKYRQILNSAIDADKIVQDKYRKHRDKIELLSKPMQVLQSSLPSGSPMASLNIPCVMELKRLMEEVEEIKADREIMESELKSATFDMKDRFLSALKADGAINEEAISVEVLGETFANVQKRVRESLARQERVLADVQRANADFCKEKTGNQSAASREQMMCELAAAHDTFMEVTANLQEGSKFYNDLTQLLVAFQNKINDFCFARKTEKDELCRDIQQAIANAPIPAQPSQPASQPPQRPPPPSTAPSMSAPQGAPTPYPVNPSQAGVAYPTYTPYPYPTVPMPTSYNPYAGAPPQPQYPTGGFNPYIQYPQAPQAYTSNYPYPTQQYQQWHQ